MSPAGCGGNGWGRPSCPAFFDWNRGDFKPLAKPAIESISRAAELSRPPARATRKAQRSHPPTCHARSHRSPYLAAFGQADRAQWPRPNRGRACDPAHRRLARARPRQADALAVHRVRGPRAALVIAVVSRAGPHVKIPEWEQVLSAGAAATSLVFAAHALGFAASWLTEWYAYDRRVLDALGVAPNEKIAGFVHIGRPAKPIEDRPRPPLDQIVTRFGAN